MIFNFIKRPRRTTPATLADLHVGERAILGDIELEPATADHLMNLGLVPGVEVLVAHSGPGGDPRIYRVEGTEVALRGELSRCIAVEPQSAAAD
ncbi:MAG TPA: FeoA family protein [Terriglobales bacterium]